MTVVDKNGYRFVVTDQNREWIRSLLIAQLRLVVWERS